MSDSSSVDRWHPSNVIGDVEDYVGKGEIADGPDYEALYADRGRVLAAVEKRVEGLVGPSKRGLWRRVA